MKPQQPDQFSQEYIDYILSDEAKGLQEKWEPKVRDWYIEPKWSMVPDIIQSERSAQIAAERSDGSILWLPTLWDLLQIIEGAGYSWTLAHYFEADEVWYTATAVRVADELGPLLEAEEYNDFMLAAAKLAVKATEEG